MSSIPTSADPRSKRPLKKRALSPASAQAAQLDALFAKPDQEIRIPDPAAAAAKRRLPAPPEIVTNVQGSSAGAGAGEFHVYKAARRREAERLRVMDEDMARERGAAEFEAAKRAHETADEERTRKNREKREKAKARKAKGAKGAKKPDGPAAGKAAEGGKANGGSGGGEKGESGEVNGSEKSAASAIALSAAADAPGIVIHDDDD